MRRRRGGFTLLEVIAVVLLTGILITFTTDFYLDLSRQSRAAVDTTRHTRRAVVLLDRIARDLESAMLVRKPGPVDPLFHPWLFLAESDDPALGAQRLKFSSHGRRPRSPEAAESDVEMVAWQLARTDDGDDYQLVRWSAPGLPPGRDLSFPSVEESEPVSRGIAEFGVFLTGAGGEPVARWDSTVLADSGELPVMAEIRLSLHVDEESGEVTEPFVRQVVFPLPPIDVEAQLEAAGVAPAGSRDSDGDGVPDEEDEDGDEQSAEADGEGGRTVAECVARYPAILEQIRAIPGAEEVYESLKGFPVRDIEPAFLGIAGIPPDCLQ
jgi:prepilin-type N-terminal cleavage/methylation domain-containing protein